MSISKDQLRIEYEGFKPLYEKLVEEVQYILTEAITAKKIKIHSLTARETKIKSFDSFYSKVLRKNLTRDFLENIEDIAAVRVICLYRSDLEKLGQAIQENFKIIKADSSRTRTETPFGYASDHYVVKLPKQCKGARYDKIKHLKCEIQVRTILMDAWAAVSHHLAYKQATDVPTDVFADFNALSGLFFVADSHFEMFRQSMDNRSEQLQENAEKGVLDLSQEINLDTMTAYLALMLPDRNDKPVDISDFISEIKPLGYIRLDQIDTKVKHGLTKALEYEKDLIKHQHEDGPPPFFTATGLMRAILDITDDRYFDKREYVDWYRKQLLRYKSEPKASSRHRPKATRAS